MKWLKIFLYIEVSAKNKMAWILHIIFNEMLNINNRIFRKDAYHRYVYEKEKSVLPRLVSPNIFIFLWILLGLLIISGIIICFINVPMFVSGPAVVTMYKDYIINDSLLAIVAFFPIENYHNLHSGQELILNDNEIKKYLKTPITSLESKIIDPKTLQEKYYLYPSIKHIAVKPCVLTIAKLESINMNVPPALFLGSIININVKIGNRRLASFIPFLKLLFKDNK